MREDVYAVTSIADALLLLNNDIEAKIGTLCKLSFDCNQTEAGSCFRDGIKHMGLHCYFKELTLHTLYTNANKSTHPGNPLLQTLFWTDG